MAAESPKSLPPPLPYVSPRERKKQKKQSDENKNKQLADSGKEGRREP